MDGSSNVHRTSFRQLETKGSNLGTWSFRGPGGKRQNQTLVRLLRRCSRPAHGVGLIFHRMGRILNQKRCYMENNSTKNSTVLVVGATGVLGMEVCRQLAASGKKVK